MLIPRGDWVVVRRAVRGADHTRGDIIKSGVPEAYAKQLARIYNGTTPGFNFWAIHRSAY